MTLAPCLLTLWMCFRAHSGDIQNREHGSSAAFLIAWHAVVPFVHELKNALVNSLALCFIKSLGSVIHRQN